MLQMFIVHHISAEPRKEGSTDSTQFILWIHTLGVCTNTGPDNIIAGDFNAHSNYWDDRIQNEEQDHRDTQGEDIENWMARSGAELGNTGLNTYRSNQGNDEVSALDLSFSTGNIRIRDWKGENFIFSDHRPITFHIEWRDPDGLTERKRTMRRISKYSYK